MRPSITTLACLLVSTAATAAPRIYPTGVTIYDPAQAWNGYVIFSAPDEHTHLIDMNGNEVRSWKFAGFPSELLDPKVTAGQRGHVLLQTEAVSGNDTSVQPGRPNLFRNKTVAEVDWNGEVVWQWGAQAPGGAARQHHDWNRLPNGNTLLLVNLVHSVPGFAVKDVLDDAIYEVTPKGEIVWKWVASEHLHEFGFSDAALQLIREHAKADYLHLNDMSALGPNKWFDGGDKRFDPNNVMIDSREANFVAIIDKHSGKIVWRLGPDVPPADAKRTLPRPVDQFSGQHDAHLIPAGLPGAGNLLLFDNQGEAGYPPADLATNRGSRILEIDPTTKQIVWEYTGEDSDRPTWSFWSTFISSARRLPNGNTLIDEGMNGRFFQVTPAGEIVWEYTNPWFAKSVVGGVKKPVNTNWVYRAQPVPYDWVPAGTPHSEVPVVPPDISTFRVPSATDSKRN